eukprot:5291913-Alexandrium_andersonii.AAC.1
MLALPGPSACSVADVARRLVTEVRRGPPLHEDGDLDQDEADEAVADHRADGAPRVADLQPAWTLGWAQPRCPA